MSVTVHPKAPLFENFRGSSKRADSNREWLAEEAEAHPDTVSRWIKGIEPIPDDLLDWLLERQKGASVTFLMHWEDAPRSEIPVRWRRPIAEDAAERVAKCLPRECESVLHWVEWRLAVDPDLDEAESPDIPRLQRLRAAVLAYLAEPCELPFAEAGGV
jgi:hypothetical protein